MSHAITLLDGAVGTNLWAMAAERGIPKVPVWQYSITHPALVWDLAAGYVHAGSGIILANTFCANGPAVSRYPGFRVDEVVSAGVRIAKAAAGNRARVALSIGPLETVPADKSDRIAAAAAYDEQIGAGADAGADCIFLQTFWEKALLTLALERAFQYDLPLLCAMTFGPDGRTYGGCTAGEFAALAAAYHPAAIGLNCSCGAEASVPVMAEFRRRTDLPLLCKPNMPPGHGPEDFVSALAPALEYVQYIGGCCGTTPEDIAALRGRINK
ncbi:MAG: homocysteine S-methyltransferase family protein [Oscillospiraceae bacterium]|nr:homocysteine S-methyltransferase family protein [Oscillospiraceae bacterium]